MHGLGDQFLASSALAQDEDRGIRRRDARDLVEELLHGRRRSDHRAEAAELAQAAAQLTDLAAEPLSPEVCSSTVRRRAISSGFTR